VSEVQKIQEQAAKAVAGAQSGEELEKIRVRYLGRKGELTAILRSLATLPAHSRGEVGAAANRAKRELEEQIRVRKSELAGSGYEKLATEDWADLTEPGTRYPVGHLHPVTRLLDETTEIFRAMGYSVVDGPEAETDWYNFEALNIPVGHPARDSQDTFYIEGGLVARTHTSSMQIRYMEEHDPPVRIIAPGRAYRNEDEDASHAWIFHQIEGLAIDRGLSMADLKGTLEAMVQGLLGAEAKLRLRPSYFSYTEPSAEMDVSCPHCAGAGCPSCGRTGWIELGGAGMVHPQVLRNVGYDPTQWRGFAFGFGPERLAMAKWGIPDVRLFWRTDLRFLEQF
jgi:phenylalanyl-tRNA synthetase alpha chain